MTVTLLPARTSQAGPVVSLSSLRTAQRAAAFLRGCLHDPAWLRGVAVEVSTGSPSRFLQMVKVAAPVIVKTAIRMQMRYRL